MHEVISGALPLAGAASAAGVGAAVALAVAAVRRGKHDKVRRKKEPITEPTADGAEEGRQE